MKKGEKTFGFTAEVNEALNRIERFYESFATDAVSGKRSKSEAEKFIKKLESIKVDLALVSDDFLKRANTWTKNIEYLNSKIEEFSKIQ